jgi:protein-tyrosine kinase
MFNFFKSKKNIISQGDSVFALTDPKSPVTEAFRTLRTSIGFASTDRNMKLILVTISTPGEGKSTVAANLAMVMAQAGNQVLVVDADLRKPTQHRKFGVINDKGLVNMLVQGKTLEEVVRPGPIEGISLVTSGPIPPNPSELFASEVTSEIFTEMKEKYDVVIIDTPPVIAVTDAVLIAAKVDGVIMVVKANVTKIDLIRDAMERMEKADAKILGVVLNQMKVVAGEYNYYYYYGATS